MGGSLFDQLNKAGLVDKKKANKLKQEIHQHKKKNKTKKGQAPALSESALLAQQAQEEKAAKDRLLNQQRKEEIEKKAIFAQVRQLIESNRISDYDGEKKYNFTDGTLIKHLYVNEKIHKELSADYLVIAKLDAEYHLVPSVVAEKIKQRVPECIIASTSGSTQEKTNAEDDPYADYQIPDDLMW